ncbi:hypothetical protein BH10ACT2_BH10ACT2_00790 [soil metagenome]
MNTPVNKRPYDGAARQAHSAATRQRIIDSGRALIVKHGYRATTIAAIASDAGVSTASVYELVGRKSVLLKELVEQALSGRDHPIAGAERDYVSDMRAQSDARTKLAIYARAVGAIQARLAPLFLALRDASTTEPEAARIWKEISDRRATNMRRLVADLATTGQLRAGLSHHDAADIIWAMNSSELYVLFIEERHWTPAHYERWLTDSWCRLLLDEGFVV